MMQNLIYFFILIGLEKLSVDLEIVTILLKKDEILNDFSLLRDFLIFMQLKIVQFVHNMVSLILNS